MNVTITTGIVAGRRTSAGNMYTEEAIKNLVAKFDPSSPYAYGGILNRGSIEQRVGKTHQVKRLFMNDRKELMAEIQILDEALCDAVKSGHQLVAKPITQHPLNKPSEPSVIRRIDVEQK